MQQVTEALEALPTRKLRGDPKRVELLSAPFRAYREFLSGDLTRFQTIKWWLKHSFRSYYFSGVPRWRLALRAIRWQARAIPHFASIGAVRSGTSTLSEYLFQHPCVVLPIAKEPGALAVSMQHVRAAFPMQRAMDSVRKQYGVAMTGYCVPAVPILWWPHLAKALNPQIKIVLILRNPVERTYSHWRWDRMRTFQWRNDPLWRHFPDFDEAVRLELNCLREGGGGFPALSGGYFVTDSIYLPFVRILFEQFGREQVKIIDAADLFSDPAATAMDAYRFIGLPEYTPIPVTEWNSSPVGEHMSDATRRNLWEFFKPYNQQLYNFLGRDFGWMERKQ